MIKNLYFAILLNILIIETIQQQAKVPVIQDPFQQFDSAIKRNLEENADAELLKVAGAMSERLRKQIAIWTSIGLALILYFIVMALIDMPNPKSSILYAKYDTTRGGNEL